jgi:hypothetical protein
MNNLLGGTGWRWAATSSRNGSWEDCWYSRHGDFAAVVAMISVIVLIVFGAMVPMVASVLVVAMIPLIVPAVAVR